MDKRNAYCIFKLSYIVSTNACVTFIPGDFNGKCYLKIDKAKVNFVSVLVLCTTRIWKVKLQWRLVQLKKSTFFRHLSTRFNNFTCKNYVRIQNRLKAKYEKQIKTQIHVNVLKWLRKEKDQCKVWDPCGLKYWSTVPYYNVKFLLGFSFFNILSKSVETVFNRRVSKIRKGYNGVLS